MRRTARLFFLALALLCAAGLAACSDEKTVGTPEGKVTVKETSQGVKVSSRDSSVSMEGDEKSGHVKIKDKDGKNIEMTYTKGKLVAGFPQDIPLYASAKITMSQLLDGRNAVATLTTKDSPENVLKFYKTELPKSGWTVANEMTVGGISVFQATKAGNSLTVQMSKQGDETGITIASAAEEK